MRWLDDEDYESKLHCDSLTNEKKKPQKLRINHFLSFLIKLMFVILKLNDYEVSLTHILRSFKNTNRTVSMHCIVLIFSLSSGPHTAAAAVTTVTGHRCTVRS